MTRAGRCLLFVALACGANVPTAVAQALWEPRPLIASGRASQSTAKWEMATAAAVGDVTVILEKTRLDEIAAQLVTALGSSGRDSEHLQWVCLAAVSGPERWIAWFVSEGSDRGIVRGVQMRRLEGTERPDARCAVIAADAMLLIAPSDVRLGMTRAEVSIALGPTSSTSSGDVVEYVHEHTQRGSPKTGPVRASNSVVIRFRGGIADAIQAWKSTERLVP